MKRFVISLVVVVFLAVPILAGEIDGGGKQPPPPPPPLPVSTSTAGASSDILIDAVLLLISIRP